MNTKFTLMLAASAFALAGPTLAGTVLTNSQSSSGANSGSVSSIYQEGTKIPNNTPGLGGTGGISTAMCMVGSGAGIVGPGIGFNFSSARLDKNCNNRAEAQMLVRLAGMHNGPGKTAGMYYICANDPKAGDTLRNMGLCPVTKQPQTVASRVAPPALPPQPVRYFKFCGEHNGTFIVVPNGNSTELTAAAYQQCMNQYDANGHVNIGTF